MANDFLQFATGGSANVESQAAYSANSDRTNGNQPGIASSALNNKALRQANFVTSQLAQMVSDFTGADAVDNTVSAQFLSLLKGALQAFAPQITKYTSSTGTHTLTYIFMIATGSATSGATYTNNAITFTVQSTVASGTVLRAKGSGAPSASGTLTKSGGSGDSTITFYAVRAPLFLAVKMVGGGGGGGATTTNVGTGGDNTTFGTTLLSANGGNGGGTNGGQGGLGGAASLGTGPVGIALTGASGSAGSQTTSFGVPAGAGGMSPFGGGAGGVYEAVGLAGITNSGSGGGGGGGSGNSACGGGSGGYVDATITTVLTTYAYAVGAGGAGGSAGGQAGGAGGSGVIIIQECYQ